MADRESSSLQVYTFSQNSLQNLINLQDISHPIYGYSG